VPVHAVEQQELLHLVSSPAVSGVGCGACVLLDGWCGEVCSWNNQQFVMLLTGRLEHFTHAGLKHTG
jgi:hypothetical protein